MQELRDCIFCAALTLLLIFALSAEQAVGQIEMPDIEFSKGCE